MPNDLEAALGVLTEKVLNLEVQVRILEGILVNKGITTPKELAETFNALGLTELKEVSDKFRKDFEKYKEK